MTASGWEMRLGDCIDGMSELADDSIDVTITDPPYDEHTHKSGRRGTDRSGYRERQSSKRASFNRVRDLGFKALSAAEMSAAGLQIGRVTKRWSLVFCTVEMVSDWRRCLEAGGLKYIRTCIWHKVGSTPQFSGDRPAQAFEAIVCAHRPGRMTWNGHGKHGYYRHPIVLERGHGEVRLHTTQKPLSLMKELVEDFTMPGELILDAYAGSATTALACAHLKRRSINFELSPDAWAIACRRLRGEEANPHESQPSLFGALA